MPAAAAFRSEPEAAALLRDFELRHNAFSIAVDGISIWRLLRFEISLHLQNIGLSRLAVRRRALVASLPRAAWQYLSAPRGFRYIGKTSNSGLRGFDDRGYYDVYFDDLIDAVPGGAKLASVDAGGYEKNERGAFRKPVFDDTSIFVASAILGRLLPSSQGMGTFAHLAKLIASDLGLPVFTAEHIRRKYSTFQSRRRLYGRVLKRLGARSVLVPNSGQFSLYMAARDVGIPFVEMQHGLFTESHPDCLPAHALNSDADVMLPDLMAVYGAYTAQLIDQTAVGPTKRLRIVGNPEIERGRQVRATDFRPSPQKPVLTFTAQAVPEAAEFIAQFLRSHDGDLEINLRLHPGYDSKPDFAASGVLDDRRVVVIPGQSFPASYELIARSDIHLSVYSSCHYDALGIGTPTMVVPGSGYQAVSDLIDRGHAVLLSSPGNLSQIVKERSWAPVPESTSRYFFEPGYQNNMRTLLEELESSEPKRG